MLILKKPLCMDDLLPAHKIFIEGSVASEGQMCLCLYYHFIVQLITIHITIGPNCFVIYLIYAKDLDKEHRVVLNQVYSFTPLLLNITSFKN